MPTLNETGTAIVLILLAIIVYSAISTMIETRRMNRKVERIIKRKRHDNE